MMIKVAFVVLAIFALQGIAEAKPQIIEFANVDERGIGDTVREALLKLSKLIETSILSSATTFQTKLTELVKYSDEVKKEVADKNAKKIEEVLQDIDELKELGNKLGIDFSDCVGNHELEIKNIPKRVDAELKLCLGEITNKAQGLVTDLINSISGNMKSVTDLTAKLNACGTGDEAVACQYSVLAEITVINGELPGKLEVEIDATSKLLNNLNIKLFQCGVLTSSTVIIETGNIFLEIATCVNDKIKKP